MESQIGIPALDMKACMMALKARTLPTERSKLPVIIRRFAAEAMMMSGASCRRMFGKLPICRNLGREEGHRHHYRDQDREQDDLLFVDLQRDHAGCCNHLLPSSGNYFATIGRKKEDGEGPCPSPLGCAYGSETIVLRRLGEVLSQVALVQEVVLQEHLGLRDRIVPVSR